MKKFIKLLLVVFSVCLIALPSTGVSAQEEGGSRLEEIKERGYIIVGVSPDYPPYEFIDPTKSGDDKYMGSDIEMAKYIAKELGVELRFEISNFDGVLTNVTSGRIDLGISGIGYTPERAKSMLMSNQYYSNDSEASCQGILVPKEKVSDFNTYDDFSGLTVAAQQGSLQEGFVNTQLPTAKISLIKEIHDGVTLLTNNNGGVDAVAVSCSSGEEFVNKNPSIAMSNVYFDTTLNESGTRIGVPLGEENLLNEVNRILDDITEQNLYDSWYKDALDASANIASIEDTGTLAKYQSILEKYGTLFLQGLLVTLGLAAITVFFGTLIGGGIALLQLLNNKIINFFIRIYVEVLRGTPLLLQLWLFITLIPMVIGVFVPGKIENINQICVTLALVINSSAYVTEIIRGGIQAVDPGQEEAAKSLGMSKSHYMRYVILPQAIKNILPSLGNEFIMMVKETSLASTFFIGDIMTVQNIVKSATYMTIEPLVITGVIYLFVTFSLSKGVSYMERRMKKSEK